MIKANLGLGASPFVVGKEDGEELRHTGEGGAGKDILDKNILREDGATQEVVVADGTSTAICLESSQ